MNVCNIQAKKNQPQDSHNLSGKTKIKIFLSTCKILATKDCGRTELYNLFQPSSKGINKLFYGQFIV